MTKLSIKISDFFSRQHGLRFYLISSFVLAFILSLTVQSWNHPDEWYQTIEFANYLGFGQLTYSPEVIHHLRNLSWPFLVSGPMKLADLVMPHSYLLMMFMIQCFSGVLNLIVLIGTNEVLETIAPELNLSQRTQTIILMCLTFTFFLVADSIRPSQEHLSIIAFWGAIYFAFKKRWFWTGFVSVAIFAFKYPAAFLSLGIFLVILYRLILKQLELKSFGYYLFGLILGCFIFGAVDLAIYGRLWESFWMYTLYNVTSGLSHKNFGEQSALVYLQYFRGQWSTLFFIWILLFPFFIYGILKTFKKNLIVILPLIFYLIAHLLIKHKEPRFMAIFDYPYILFSGIGFFICQGQPKLKKIVMIIFLLVNVFLLGREIKGDLFRYTHTFLQAGNFSKDDNCATITLKKPYAFYFNHLSEIPPMGYWPMHRKESLEVGFNKTLNWLELAPTCGPNQTLMIQVPYWEDFWQNQTCEIQSSYFLGPNFTKKLSELKLIDGIWLKCKSDILQKFKKIEVKHILVNKILKQDSLPPLKTRGEDLIDYQKKLEQQNNWWIGSFPEW